MKWEDVLISDNALLKKFKKKLVDKLPNWCDREIIIKLLIKVVKQTD